MEILHFLIVSRYFLSILFQTQIHLFFHQKLDFGSDESSSNDSDINEEFMFNGQDPKEIFKDCEEEEELSDEELFEKEFSLHKRDYYINKMKYPEMTE